MQKHLLFFFLFFYSFVYSQRNEGIVKSENSKKPLSFVVVKQGNKVVTVSDFDGEFWISDTLESKEYTFSKIGYKSKTISFSAKNRQLVFLEPNDEKEQHNSLLAIQLIQNAIKNKEGNNYKLQLNSFQYDSYSRTIVSANVDSLKNQIDTIYRIKKGKKVFKKLDSTNYKFRKELEKSHIYLIEKASEIKYEKGKKEKEYIEASMMAGLKTPVYEILAHKLQSFEPYAKDYLIAETKYINPIADKAFKYYDYQLLDKTSDATGEKYIIEFIPKKDKKRITVKGYLIIDAMSFAITKIHAEITGLIDLKIVQDYTYLKNYDLWFPKHKTTFVKKGANSGSVEVFGQSIKIIESNNKMLRSYSTAKVKPEDVVYIYSNTYISDIKTDIPISLHNNSATVIYEDKNQEENQEVLEKFRTLKLTQKDKNTYKLIDSIFKDKKVEKKLYYGRNILNGVFPTKYLNLNLGKIINLNNYEGFRIGLGGKTTEEVSKSFRLNAYFAYGTKDNKFKYHYGIEFPIKRLTNTWIGVGYTNDLKEAAALDFILENKSFSPVNPRNLNISKFYNYKTIEAYITHDIQPNLEAKIKVSGGSYDPLFNYHFISIDRLFHEYDLSLGSIAINYNPLDEYMYTPIGKLRIKNGYPKMTFQVTKSFQDVAGSDFDFTQFNFRVVQELKQLRKGKTTILVQGGIVFGEAPISHLYNATPNYTLKNPWFRRITFAGKNAFETMRYNEFISDKYAMVQIFHKFKPLEIVGKFQPQISLITRAAIGDIEYPLVQKGISFKSMNRGYYESGFELNNIIKGLGLSAFYRYGPYSNPIWSDNLAVKATLHIKIL
ncbi:DUF5686 family protein [Aureivirga marina]|uniref:DUF5686 family protein n=1 Tax=Aureivirga marina TaxID=1182451 RepID=UPI0018C99768|nr:DUF5686 family protein [Aureivirga marina]